MELLTEGFYAWHVSDDGLNEFDDASHKIVNGHLYGLGTYYEIGRPDKNYDMYHQGRKWLSQYKVWVNLNSNQLLDLTGAKSLNQLNKPLTLNQIMVLYKAKIFQPRLSDIINKLLKIRDNKNYYIDPNFQYEYDKNKDYELFAKITYLENLLRNMLSLLFPNDDRSEGYYSREHNFVVNYLKKMGLYDYFKLAHSGEDETFNKFKYHIKSDEDFITLTKFASKVENMVFPMLTKIVNAAPLRCFFEPGFNFPRQIKLVMSMLKVYGFIINPDSAYGEDIRYLILWKNKGIVSILGNRKKIHQQFDDEAEAQEIADWMARGDSGAF